MPECKISDKKFPIVTEGRYLLIRRQLLTLLNTITVTSNTNTGSVGAGGR